MNSQQNVQTAIVTGAAGDVGQRYAQGLAARGYSLVLVGRDAGPLEALAERIRAQGGTAESAVHDLAASVDVDQLVTRIAREPALGLVANIAGSAAFGPFASGSPTAYAETIAVNVMALTRLNQAAAARFAGEGQGTIVNFASVLAFRPWPEFNVYNASKAFVVALSQAMQGELAGKGVLVQVVVPPATATGFWQKAGFSFEKLPPQAVMQMDDLVTGALKGLDAREEWVIPSLEDVASWEAFQKARNALVGGIMNGKLATRYASTGS
jgi:short-subunit dehydrogenase